MDKACWSYLCKTEVPHQLECKRKSDEEDMNLLNEDMFKKRNVLLDGGADCG